MRQTSPMRLNGQSKMSRPPLRTLCSSRALASGDLLPFLLTTQLPPTHPLPSTASPPHPPCTPSTHPLPPLHAQSPPPPPFPPPRAAPTLPPSHPPISPPSTGGCTHLCLPCPPLGFKVQQPRLGPDALNSAPDPAQMLR
jgi:hypothetical protein